MTEGDQKAEGAGIVPDIRFDRLPILPGDIILEPGYRIDPVVVGLTYPTSVTFDDSGNVYVGEAGFSYGPAKADGMGRILQVGWQGQVREIARGFRGPMTSITWNRGFFHVAEGAFPGRILRVGRDGQREVLVDGLRSGGDHYTSEIAFDPSGTMFFGVGTFTNSAVVGFDNFLGHARVPCGESADGDRSLARAGLLLSRGRA